jgi:hypothetical protein
LGANKPTMTAWRTATQAAPVEVTDDGDVFKPLRKLLDKYLAKANYLTMLGKDASYYLRAAKAVRALIPNKYEEALTVELTLAAA